MKKSGLIVRVLAILFLIVIINFVSAKIEISEPEQIYNFGDKLYFTASVLPTSIYGFFEINLVCENSTLNMYKMPANEEGFPLGEENKYSNHISITKDSIGDLKGICYVEAVLGSESVKTKTFEITDKIILEAETNQISYNPGEEVKLTIKATKSNGYLLEGFADISGVATASKTVEKGVSEISFGIPKNMEAGIHQINVYVYNKGKDNLFLNQGNSTLNINVNQVPSLIDTSLSETNIIPGNSIKIMAEVYDQTGEKINEIISIKLMSMNGNQMDYSSISGETKEINFTTNETAGKWKIIASIGNLTKENNFYITELQKASFEFIDEESILLVKNIGNVPYNKTIEVQIGDKPLKIEGVTIKIGEERKFKLSAPNGEYQIILDDGTDKVQRNLALTGNAISLKSLGNFNPFDYRLVWFFIALILIALIIVLVAKNKEKFKRSKSQRMSMPILNFSNRNVSSEADERKKELATYIPRSSSGGDAESSLVMEGKRYNSVILAISISNSNSLRASGKEEIEKIKEIAKANKAMTELKDGYLLAIFSPLVTRTIGGNEMLAVKTGFQIHSELENYSRRAVDKIHFNIGIHSGELLTSMQKGRFRYTSLGNTLLLARRIADSDHGKVLISDSIRSKLLRTVKVSTVKEIGKTKVYTLSSITDIEANKEKFNDILKRMKNSQ